MVPIIAFTFKTHWDTGAEIIANRWLYESVLTKPSLMTFESVVQVHNYLPWVSTYLVKHLYSLFCLQ